MSAIVYKSVHLFSPIKAHCTNIRQIFFYILYKINITVYRAMNIEEGVILLFPIPDNNIWTLTEVWRLESHLILFLYDHDGTSVLLCLMHWFNAEWILTGLESDTRSWATVGQPASDRTILTETGPDLALLVLVDSDTLPTVPIVKWDLGQMIVLPELPIKPRE